jgi:hypothetical protein
MVPLRLQATDSPRLKMRHIQSGDCSSASTDPRRDVAAEPFERAAVLEIGVNPVGSKCVVADVSADVGRRGAPEDCGRAWSRAAIIVAANWE